MMPRKKICFVTGTRAEYGLLRYLMKEIKSSKVFQLQLVVTGSHLSHRHGYTVNEIINDGFQIDASLDIELEKDDKDSVCVSLSKCIEKFSEALEDLRPELVVVLGDRYELLGAVAASMIHRVPIAHIHGGEITEGAFDDGIRHAITKLSQLHFVAAFEYKKRIIQLGENPNLVFEVGGLGVDAIKKISLLTRDQLEKSLDLKFRDRNFLITYHPLTIPLKEDSEFEIKQLIDGLSSFKDALQIFTMPNADPGNKEIFNLINDYAYRNDNVYTFESLGQLRYLSCLSQIDAVIGNSSSGLLEVPSFRKATINIGDRQKGRLCGKSVINCSNKSSDIEKSIKKVFTKAFQNCLKEASNPYGEGGASQKIVNILENTDFDSLKRKPFFDIKY